jgi:hypothetical protein
MLGGWLPKIDSLEAKLVFSPRFLELLARAPQKLVLWDWSVQVLSKGWLRLPIRQQ